MQIGITACLRLASAKSLKTLIFYFTNILRLPKAPENFRDIETAQMSYVL